VIRSEDLRARREETMHRVHSFLGVDPGWSAPDQDREYNAIAVKSAPGPLMRAARHVPGSSRVRLLAPGAVTAAERLLGRSRRPVDVTTGTISPELRRRLLDELAPDLERLPGLVGGGFDAWSPVAG
jgi:hypothetical protein